MVVTCSKCTRKNDSANRFCFNCWYPFQPKDRNPAPASLDGNSGTDQLAKQQLREQARQAARPLKREDQKRGPASASPLTAGGLLRVIARRLDRASPDVFIGYVLLGGFFMIFILPFVAARLCAALLGFSGEEFGQSFQGTRTLLVYVPYWLWLFPNLLAQSRFNSVDKARDPRITSRKISDTRALIEKTLFTRKFKTHSWNPLVKSEDPVDASWQLTANLQLTGSFGGCHSLTLHLKLKETADGCATQVAYWFDAAHPWYGAGAAAAVAKETDDALTGALKVSP